MAHHYATQLWYTETHKYRERIADDLRKHHAMVFQAGAHRRPLSPWRAHITRHPRSLTPHPPHPQVSIVELSALVLFNDFERIASRHFIDYSGKLSTQDAADLMRARARRVQFESYSASGEWRHAFEAAARAARRAHGGDLDVATREKFRNSRARAHVTPPAPTRGGRSGGAGAAERGRESAALAAGDRGVPLSRGPTVAVPAAKGGGGARRRSKSPARVTPRRVASVEIE